MIYKPDVCWNDQKMDLEEHERVTIFAYPCDR